MGSKFLGPLGLGVGPLGLLIPGVFEVADRMGE